MKFCITGASGFIGENLKQFLKQKKLTFIPLNRDEGGDIEKDSYFANAEKQVREGDAFIHLAGKTFVPESWEKPLSYFNTNLNGTLNCLEFCRKHQLKFIYVSSYMYGSPERLPVTESDPVKVNNPYALSKKMAEEAVQFYGEKFNVPYVIIRPFNIYGPHQKSEFLIPTIIHQVLSDQKEIELRDLNPKRDYVHIHDTVKAIYLCSLQPKNNIVNVCSGKSYSVKEIVDTAQKIAHTDKVVKTLREQRSNEIDDCYGSYDFILEQYNWMPEIELYNGLKQIIN